MKALIVEDEEIVRELLESVALREFSFDAVKGSGDGEEAWEIFASEPFDFVVTDLVLPSLDGLSLAQRMLAAVPEICILAISSECDDYVVRKIQRSGILGFADKSDMSLEILFEAFNEVSAGHVYHSPTVQKKIVEMWEDPDAYYKVLSDSEIEVVQAIASGHDKDKISEALGISVFTVRRHKHNSMKKLNISDEASLVRFALDCGMIKNKGGLNWTARNHRKL